MSRISHTYPNIFNINDRSIFPIAYGTLSSPGGASPFSYNYINIEGTKRIKAIRITFGTSKKSIKTCRAITKAETNPDSTIFTY